MMAAPRMRSVRASMTTLKKPSVWPRVLARGTAAVARPGGCVTSIQMAMLGDLTWQQVRDAVITHPTMSEGLNIVLDSLG